MRCLVTMMIMMMMMLMMMVIERDALPHMH
jgi:hypothetical protein